MNLLLGTFSIIVTYPLTTSFSAECQRYKCGSHEFRVSLLCVVTFGAEPRYGRQESKVGVNRKNAMRSWRHLCKLELRFMQSEVLVTWCDKRTTKTQKSAIRQAKFHRHNIGDQEISGYPTYRRTYRPTYQHVEILG